jgi:hypothetical protein
MAMAKATVRSVFSRLRPVVPQENVRHTKTSRFQNNCKINDG